MGVDKTTSKRGAGKKRAFSALTEDRASGLTVAEIEERVGDADPAPIRTKFVVVKGRRYPPVQVMDLVLGKHEGIASAAAQRRLQRVGLVTGRVERAAKPRIAAAENAQRMTDTRADFEAELRAHVGEWVATRGDGLLIAAPEAKTVVAWLNEHHERADMMYKVPRDLSEVSGSAA